MKPELDQTDAEILRLLVEDGRRPYSEIAEKVGMSSPSIISRVERLQEMGVLEGFEARIDRSVLGTSRLLLRFTVRIDRVGRTVEALSEDGRVETVFGSADGTVTVVANLETDEVAELFEPLEGTPEDLTVESVLDEAHSPTVETPSFAPECVECGNTVDDEGVSESFGDNVYHFCCTSCESNFKDRYESLG